MAEERSAEDYHTMKNGHSRRDRLADQIKREVSEIVLFEVKDPRVDMVTITHAEMVGDLKHATVFFSTLKQGKERAATLQGLKQAAGFIQKRLGQRIHIRYVPHLSFQFDDSLEHASHMQQIFRELEEKEKASE
jgi:ribosome-binding factor A